MPKKYEWTDWIQHVPGQRLPIGFHGIFEQLGSRTRGGKPWQSEGTVTRDVFNCPVWDATNPDGAFVMLLRYKLRIEREDAEIQSSECLKETA